MRFKYIVPVYVAEANKRPPGYVPGVYEVSETTGEGIYSQNLNKFMDPIALRNELEMRSDDLTRLGLSVDYVFRQASKQLLELDLNLERQGNAAKFNPHEFPKITQRKPNLDIPIKPYPFKHYSFKLGFKHSLFRVYGVRMDDIIVLTGFVLKTSEQMEEVELLNASSMYDYFHNTDFDLTQFQDIYFPLDDYENFR